MDELSEVLPPCLLIIKIIILGPTLSHNTLKLASEIMCVAEGALVDTNRIIVSFT